MNRGAGLLSRLLTAHIARDLDQSIDEARAFLRNASPRSPDENDQDDDGDNEVLLGAGEERREGTDENNEVSLDFNFENQPWTRCVTMLAPFVALLLLKLIYEFVPIVLSLAVLTATHEWLYTQFTTHVELMKSMQPSITWLGTLFNLAATVVLASYLFLDTATGLNGLSDSLFFHREESTFGDITSSVITLLWALLLVNAVASLYVLCAKIFLVTSMCIFDQLFKFNRGGEGYHRDDERSEGGGEGEFFERFERISVVVKTTGYIGFLYRTILPVIFWGAFYSHSRFAAGSLQALYFIAKFMEISIKSYAVGRVLHRLCIRGGGNALGMHLTAEEIMDEGGAERQCPICFETLHIDRSPVKLDCGHMFCARCIGMWASDKQEVTCAVCRAPIQVDEENKKVDQYSADLAFHCSRWNPILL